MINQADNFLSLRVIALSDVILHEQTDPERVSRLLARLEQDMLLKNPPIVAEWGDRYVVLDGATRTTALRQMNYNYMVAQVVSPTDQLLGLQTWSHIKQDEDVEKFLETIKALPDIIMEPVDLQLVQDTMPNSDGLCYLALANGNAFLVTVKPGCDKFSALGNLVATYIEQGHIARTSVVDFYAVKQEYPRMTGLFVFPKLTINQVLEIADMGNVLPAGITRFIVPSRVLRMNLDLTWLQRDEPLAQKAVWLNQMVDNLVSDRRIRFYEEPVYLLDE